MSSRLRATTLCEDFSPAGLHSTACGVVDVVRRAIGALANGADSAFRPSGSKTIPNLWIGRRKALLATAMFHIKLSMVCAVFLAARLLSPHFSSTAAVSAATLWRRCVGLSPFTLVLVVRNRGRACCPEEPLAAWALARNTKLPRT